MAKISFPKRATYWPHIRYTAFCSSDNTVTFQVKDANTLKVLAQLTHLLPEDAYGMGQILLKAAFDAGADPKKMGPTFKTER
jgi:hypothetical protein